MRYTATKRQHVLPKASIVRFYSTKKTVDVYLFSRGKHFLANANNDLFITNRKWDEGMEVQSRLIESEFQKIIDTACFGKNKLTDQENRIVNNFHSIISERSKAKYYEFDQSERVMEFVNPEDNQDEIDKMESQNIFMGGSDQIGRIVFGLGQRISITQSQLNNREWGIITSNRLEFMVSDNYHATPLVPINPVTYLSTYHKGRTVLSDKETIDINNELARNSRHFFFARDLALCGINYA